MEVVAKNPQKGKAYGRSQAAQGASRRLPRPKDLRREARLWRLIALVTFLLCAVALTLNVALAELRPSNVWGLSYGIAAAVLLVTSALYGVRRRTMRKATSFAGRGRRGLVYSSAKGRVSYPSGRWP